MPRNTVLVASLSRQTTSVGSREPGSDAPLRPADAAGAIPAEKADVAAAGQDVDADVFGHGHRLERLGGDKRVVAGREDKRGYGDARQQGQRRGPPVIIERVGKAVA